MSVQKLSDPPELVPLCQEDEDGEEQVAGWAMVLADHVVAYVPDESGFGAASYTFDSLDNAEWLLGYSGIYPARDRATVPHALDSAPHH
jgi:hypothetical protein